MSYYKNNYGKVAKVLRSWGRVVVMLEYKTIFFNDPGRVDPDASFFYKGG